jgi:hypothetical protein
MAILFLSPSSLECLREVGDGLSEERIVERSPSGSRIPSLGRSETILAADRGAVSTSAAVVDTLNNVIVDGLVDLVEDRVQEANSLLASSLTVTVDKGNHAAEDGGSSRGTRDLEPLTTNDNIVGIAKGGNVRVSPTSAIHVLGRNVGSSAEVGLHSRGLPRGLREVNGETATRGDDGALVGHADLLITRGVKSRTHGRTDGGNIGNVGGILGEETALGLVITSLITSNAIVTRSNEDGHAAKTHLADLIREEAHVRLVLEMLGTTI